MIHRKKGRWDGLSGWHCVSGIMIWSVNLLYSVQKIHKDFDKAFVICWNDRKVCCVSFFFLLIILNCYIGVSIIVSNYIILLNSLSTGNTIWFIHQGRQMVRTIRYLFNDTTSSFVQLTLHRTNIYCDIDLIPWFWFCSLNQTYQEINEKTLR